MSKSRLEILQELNEVGELIDKYTSSYSKQRKGNKLTDIETRMNSLFKEIREQQDRETYNKLIEKLTEWYSDPKFSETYKKRKPRVPNIKAIEKLVDIKDRLKELAKLEKKTPFIAQQLLESFAKSGQSKLLMTENNYKKLEEEIFENQKLKESKTREGKKMLEEMEIGKKMLEEIKKDEELKKEPPSPPPLPTPRTTERLIQEQQELEKKEAQELEREAMEEEELETRVMMKEEEMKEEEMKEEEKEEEEMKDEEMKEEEMKEEAKVEEEETKAEEKEEAKVEEELTMEEIHNNIRKEEREKVMKEFNLVDPTIGTIDIPKERLGIEGKTLKILNDDIKYFINRFPDMLKMEADVYKKTNKKNKKALQDIHRRIQAKLSPDPKKEEEGKKVGIILDADKFIDMKISELLATKTLEGLTPANLVDITEEPKSEGRDVGSYTITKNRNGRDVINNAPVYRSIPTTQPEKPKRKGEIKQDTIYKKTAMDKVDIARMEMRDNPFIRKQMTKPLNIIL